MPWFSYIYFFQTPLGQIHLRGARIEEVDRSCDSETDSDDTAIPDYTLGIWPTNYAPTYLMILTKHEKVLFNDNSIFNSYGYLSSLCDNFFILLLIVNTKFETNAFELKISCKPMSLHLETLHLTL